MINFLEKEKVFNTFIIYVSSIEFLCVLIVFVIDTYLHVEIMSSSACAYDELFAGAPFNIRAVGIAMIVFASSYSVCALVVYFTKAWFISWTRQQWPKLIRRQSCALLFFELVHQSLFCVWVSCINNMSQLLINIRCLIVIIFTITCLIFTVYFTHVSRQNENRDGSSKTALFNYLLLFVLFVISIVSMAMVKPGNNDIVTNKDIKIGVFNSEQFWNIIDGSYVKDSTYKTRILTDLNTLTHSKRKIDGPTVCDDEGCGVSYYYLYTTVKIDCDNNASKSVFYLCNYAQSVFIKFDYRSDDFRYPTSGCAYLLNGKCYTDCNVLTFFVQERAGTVEPAWKGFSKYQKPFKFDWEWQIPTGLKGECIYK